MAVRWNDDDWDTICREIYRTNPGINLNSKEFWEVKPQMVLEAMRSVLPEARWHLSMNLTQKRPFIIDSFHRLRDELKASKDRAEEEKRQVMRERLDRDRQRRKAVSFGPMLDVVAESLFLKMLPMLEHYLDARLAGQSIDTAKGIALTPVLPTVKRLKIGVVGLLPIQFHELEKHFPQLDIVLSESHEGPKHIYTKMHSCAQVFVLVSKTNHGVGEKFPRGYVTNVVGGVSAMKRNIEVWIAASKPA